MEWLFCSLFHAGRWKSGLACTEFRGCAWLQCAFSGRRNYYWGQFLNFQYNHQLKKVFTRLCLCRKCCSNVWITFTACHYSPSRRKKIVWSSAVKHTLAVTGLGISGLQKGHGVLCSPLVVTLVVTVTEYNVFLKAKSDAWGLIHTCLLFRGGLWFQKEPYLQAERSLTFGVLFFFQERADLILSLVYLWWINLVLFDHFAILLLHLPMHKVQKLMD